MLCTLQQEVVPAPSVPWSSAEVFSLAAESQVNDRKPHQGVAGKNPGLHRGPAACNSTTALGVSWRLWSGTVPGARVSYEYDAFGNEVNHTGTTPNNYLYRGEQYDSDLGLYYLRARYMNPATGRFISRDPEEGKPVDPKTLHKYLYASGDPVNRVDPRGRDDLVEYAGNFSNVLSHYNNANNPRRFGQCQSQIYSGIASVLVNPVQSEEVINALGPAEGTCIEDLLNGIISPVPTLPWD